MKPAKAILAILATFGATAASASTVVHWTGSTAYRGPTSQAIVASFDAGTSLNVAGISSGKALSSQNQAFYHGTIGGADTIIETSWTGSVGGVDALVNGSSNINFLPDNTDTGGIDPATGAAYVYQTITVPAAGSAASAYDVSSGSFTGYNTHGAGVAPYGGFYTTNPHTADVANSDTYQSSTVYTSVRLTGATITKAGGGTTTEIIGVVPFVWVRSNATDTAALSITNISNQQINILFGAGQVTAQLFTGTTANGDATTPVYAFGRDPESGTRLNAFAESGLGANASVIQYQPTTGTGSSTTVTAVNVWPSTYVGDLGLTFTGGNAGEASGGTLAGYIDKQFASGLGCAITYLGTSDASTALKGVSGTSAVGLTYNGNTIIASQTPNSLTAPTFNYAPIENGQYTYWGYEHVLLSPSIGTAVKTVANLVASNVYNTTAQVFMSQMQVARPGDGGQVSN